MLTKLKQRVQEALTGEAKAAHRLGLTPNMITAIGFIIAFFSAMAYAQWRTQHVILLLAVILLLLSGFCDALDGVSARLYHQTTAFGGFLDSLLDRYADSVVYMGIILGGLCSPVWGLMALAGSFLVSYSRARAEAAGIKMETIGLAERPERIVILSLATAVALFLQTETVMNVGIIILAVLTNATVLQRSAHVYTRLKETGKQAGY